MKRIYTDQTMSRTLHHVCWKKDNGTHCQVNPITIMWVNRYSIKNNTLYYIQGDDKLYGMSYTGEHDALLLGTANVVRALYETILAVRSVESGELITRNGTQAQDDPATDGSLNGDLAIQLQVTYSNITESRARVYKDDLSGFETDRTKYVNESSNINESASIGSFAQQLVNRLGGTKISVSGVADDLSDIAELGDIDLDGRVYTGIHIKPATKIEWEYLLVQDYNVISSYIGVNSRHRVEEIPSSNVTNRTLRYQSRFVFTETQQSYSTRLISAERILGAITGLTDDGINYGYLECNLSDGTQRKIHLSVDSDSKGKTIELKWKLKDNYSAGLKRYSITVGSNTLWINSDVPYTDYYGKVNDIWFGLYFGTLGAIDVDDYPEATISDGDDAFVILSDDIDKDAGEIIHGLVEIPILSENPKIRVYDGFAKWNTLVTGTERIKCAGLLYTPIKKRHTH